ncbi:hypothetical protein [Staphylococcus equorum]|uniref:hypothetical protein n=1 Tax=Staphylococcus equorum TaxID=246432 RepID=UPI00192CF8BB|nr:hypothetical protein [Staphylococcus equorum]
MSNYAIGADALKRFTGGTTDQNVDNKFTKFGSGSEYNVKVLGTADVMEAKTYSHFQNPKIATFTAKRPSKIYKDGGEFIYENPTSWDIISKALYERSQKKFDADHQAAGQVSRKSRFAFGFFDLDKNEPVVVDVTATQAKALYETISKHADKLSQRIFKLSKTGKGKDTKVALDVVFPGEETDTQATNAENAPIEFPIESFNGLYFEKSDDDMKKDLQAIGYNLADFGIEVPKEENEDDPTKNF